MTDVGDPLQKAGGLPPSKHQVSFQAPVGGVDFGYAALPLLLEFRRGKTAEEVEDLPDQLYFVHVKLSLAHLAIHVADDALLGGEQNLHQVASELLQGSGFSPGCQNLGTWQETGVGQLLVR